MMVSSRSTVSLCSRHTQFKKFLFYLCVVAWLALFFMSGKLFLQRREESSRLQVSTDKTCNTCSSFSYTYRHIFRNNRRQDSFLLLPVMCTRLPLINVDVTSSQKQKSEKALKNKAKINMSELFTVYNPGHLE